MSIYHSSTRQAYKMLTKDSNMIVEQLHPKILENQAKHLARHPTEARCLPRLRPDHDEYFRRCFRMLENHGLNMPPKPHDRHKVALLYNASRLLERRELVLRILGKRDWN